MMEKVRDLSFEHEDEIPIVNSKKNHLLMIGIDEYSNGINSLTNAVRDIYAVKNVLSNKYMFDGDSIIITDKEATRERIYGVFYDLLGRLDETDNLFIYYAGHSDLDKYSNGYWVPSDARKKEFYTYVDTEILRRCLRQLKAKHVFLISDSCYSYDWFSDHRGEIRATVESENYRSRYAFCSGRYKVSDGKMGEHSPFATELIHYLNNAIDDFHALEMVEAVKKRLRRLSDDQDPRCEHIPYTNHKHGEFFFRQREVSTEANFWRKISLNPTIDLLEEYMKLYPLGKGKFYEKAEIELDKIKYSDLANIEWEKAKKEDTKKAYISFYEVYSYHHNLAVQALKKIKLLDKREKKKEDTIAWEKAILEFTKESFIEYSQNFPTGKYVDKAKKIIDSFQNRHLKTNIIGDFDYYIEVMEFVNSLQNVSYQRVEKQEANVYDVFYNSSMEILKKVPNIVIYLLMCESIYKDFHINKIKSEFVK